MKESFEKFRKEYFGDDLPIEVKTYNGFHVIAVLSLLLSMGLIQVFFPTVKSMLAAFVTACFGVFVFYEGNRTGFYEACAIIMSCCVNFLFFPMLYFEYGRLSFCIPIYFIFGLLYNTMLLSKKKAIILTAVEFVAYLGILIAGIFLWIDSYTPGNEQLIDYFAVLVGILISSISAGVAIKYRMYLHNLEQKNLEKLRVEAMDAYVSKDIFLANMSHEIRTPMNAIVGTVDLLLDQDVNDHVRECVYNILNSCNALLSLTDEVMDLSKSETDEIKLVYARYDLRELLMEIVNMMAVRLMDSSVRMIIDINDTIPRFLYGDGAKIRQVFINLLNNAVKYTKEGKIFLRVDYESISGNELMLKVEVEDTGVGIKEESIPHLFESYKRVDVKINGMESVEGTGLGLAICKEIVEKMDGKIYVRSKFREGSTFGFEIPQQEDTKEKLINIPASNTFNVLIYTDEDETMEIKRMFESLHINCDFAYDKNIFENYIIHGAYSHLFISLSAYQDNRRFLERNLNKERVVIMVDVNESVSLDRIGYIMTRPIHILNVAAVLMNENSSYTREIIKKGGFYCPEATVLVVDDNLTNLKVASGIIRKFKANVLTALSGKECLAILEREHVDLIFMDYMMPEMNGIDTLINIRQMNNPALDDVPVIALTANVVNGAREMFIEAGFNDYISKPVDIDKLERVMRLSLPKELLITRND